MKTIFTLAITCLFASMSFAQTRNNSNETQHAHDHSHDHSHNSKLSETDQLLIAVQKICPVSGSELGSMGDPIKVQAGGQALFLCCKGCQGKKISEEHWKTIQARRAQAQGTCPIMGKAVDATMKSTIVNGQQIFVCCPPCIAKIQADVEGSLKKVNAGYASFVAQERQASSDQMHIQAQGILSNQSPGWRTGPVSLL